MVSRRDFFAPALIGLTRKPGRAVAGGFVNESHLAGHALRNRVQPAAKRAEATVPLLIVGGGIAGLSAAWRLQRAGFRDFLLLEMEREAGGNSRAGRNDVSAYPWAAHYVPVPDTRATLLRAMLEDLGVLRDGRFEERYLCFSPQERLYLHGRWQEGIEPYLGASAKDREQFRRFHDAIAAERASGHFRIPVHVTASPLDAFSMEEWMQRQGFDSPYLRWYVDYACRDDYGAPAAAVSAYAGVHYFAAREHEEKGPLTWPEGNGWIVARLIERIKPHVRAGEAVRSIRRSGRKLIVDTASARYTARAVIFAAPSLLAPYIVEGSTHPGIVYSPWVTANLTLDRMPAERGIERAWDNVIYGSPSLGYVVATHMSLASRTERSVWTWYHALADAAPAESRRALLSSDWSYWRDFILRDLSRAHPDLSECVSRIDVMRFGHAMARPVPGILESPSRRALAAAPGPIFYANSDVSGYSIFEEAQYRGVIAAERALRTLS